MSPMIDLQRRHASVFRIRLGDQGTTETGKSFPRKLTNAIRITAANEAVCQAFVDVYGGEVKPWTTEGRNEFEAYLPTTSLSILVLPGEALQQWWEAYKKSVCVTRCDGERDVKAKKPCHCPADIEQRMTEKSPDGKRRLWCAPMTRVNVLCPDVAVVGSGALVTHSLIAAETLPQSIAVAEAALSRGLMVPARLRVVEHKGLTHYIVPQIEIVGVSLSELVGAGEASALESVTDAPSLSAVPSWKPVGELPAAPFVSIADQLSEVATPQPKPVRKNAAQALPSTGLAPRTAAQASAEAAPMLTAAKAKQRLMEACDGDKTAAASAWGDRGSDPIAEADLTAIIDALPVLAEVVEDDEPPAPKTSRALTLLQTLCSKDPDLKDRDARLTWAAGILGHDVASFSDLKPTEVSKLIKQIEEENVA